MPYKGQDRTDEINEYYASNPSRRGYLPPYGHSELGQWLYNVTRNSGGLSENEKDALSVNGFADYIVRSARTKKSPYELSGGTPVHSQWPEHPQYRHLTAAAHHQPVAAQAPPAQQPMAAAPQVFLGAGGVNLMNPPEPRGR
ncbi:hypothetical protein [Streptomyces sp. NPDC058394]|uniref:hypothetical protein n=1 Tax=Streptomyces sp. NPDC058394 TaxID=3346477 RepID=UPI00365C7E69